MDVSRHLHECMVPHLKRVRIWRVQLDGGLVSSSVRETNLLSSELAPQGKSLNSVDLLLELALP